jgi:histidyl-tRNA synthetase
MITLFAYTPKDLGKEKSEAVINYVLSTAQKLRKAGYSVDGYYRNDFNLIKNLFLWAWKRGLDRVWIIGASEMERGTVFFATIGGVKEAWTMQDFLES